MLSDRPTIPPPDNPHARGLIPKVVPPLPRENPHARHLPWHTAFRWLRQGWSDLWANPLPSLLYGAVVFLVSVAVVWLLVSLGLDYALLPALAGFMVIGPLVANGLYEKSRRLEAGERATFASMVFVAPRSGYQALFLGVILLCLFLLWMRAAVLIYALFFGIRPFPGTDEIVPMLVSTPAGWAMLLVGTGIGGLFAAFAFAISVFAVPMLLEEKTDALSAPGISMAMVWNNLAVMLAWGAIVMVLFLVCVATGLVGLVLVFPLLGHGTWHAYRAIRGHHRGEETERMFIQPA
jgi:uncharacterized membrane protein